MQKYLYMLLRKLRAIMLIMKIYVIQDLLLLGL